MRKTTIILAIISIVFIVLVISMRFTPAVTAKNTENVSIVDSTFTVESLAQQAAKETIIYSDMKSLDSIHNSVEEEIKKSNSLLKGYRIFNKVLKERFHKKVKKDTLLPESIKINLLVKKDSL